MSKKIILTGGGTAGHVMPALALIPELKRRFGEVHWIGRKEGMEKELVGNDAVYHGIDCPKFDRSKPTTALAVPFKLMKAADEAEKLIRQIAPDVIFSKGGYVSLPAALGKGDVPLVLHESDTSLGLANKLAAQSADAVCSSFPLPDFCGVEIIHTGSPLRSGIYSGNRELALAKCGFDGKRKVLLITGGSLGAKAINDGVDGCIETLTDRFDVIHIRGRGNDAEKRKGYYPISFTSEIFGLLAAADFAVTRGGGNSLFELGALAVPMLIIPLPKGASRGDQVENAAYFKREGLALTLDQDDIGKLPAALTELENSAPHLIAKMKRYAFDGTGEIIRIIERVSGINN